MANTGNTQQIIDYGASANDGLGDPLRTAFIKTEENFNNIWLAGPVGSNITIVNNTIGVQNTNGNLTLAPNGVGVIQVRNAVIPWIDSVYDLGSPTNFWRNIYASGISSDNLEISGDLSVNGNLIVSGNTIEVGNITTDSKIIHLANSATTQAQANNSGIVLGANSNIASFLWHANGYGWTSNNNMTVNNGTFTVTNGSVNGNRWSINSTILSAPTGAAWVSNKEFNTEYINSAPGGYIDISTLKPGNVFDESTSLHIDQDYFEFTLYDGATNKWRFNSEGNTAFPNYTFPSGDGASGQAFVTDGNGNISWANINNYANSDVVELLGHFGSNNISTTGNVSSGLLNTRIYDMGNIPDAVNAGSGSRVFVIDADSKVFANLYVGGAGNSVPVYSDGSNWYIG